MEKLGWAGYSAPSDEARARRSTRRRGGVKKKGVVFRNLAVSVLHLGFQCRLAAELGETTALLCLTLATGKDYLPRKARCVAIGLVFENHL